MTKMTKGPAFLRFIAPLLNVLKESGGSGIADDVTDALVQRLELSEEEQAETKWNPSSVRNQIGWARFYLSKAGLLHASQRGVWVLTRKGTETRLESEDDVLSLYKSVRDQFEKVVEDTEGTGPLPEEDEDVATDLALPASDESAALGVEAEGEEGGTGEAPEPYDASKTQIVTKQLSVEQIEKRLRYDEIDLAPDFQRKADLWTEDKKSRLIESMLIRIPLPVFYFDATDDTKWLVVDGLQRLSTIRHFMVEEDESKRLRLKGLEYLKQHQGKTFKELPRDLQRRIEETQIFAHMIQPGTPIEVKFNIFKRINTGGLVLTGQEIRHALYQKPGGRKDGATHLLRELADSPDFHGATDGAIANERMLDCEFVLRFISFSLTPYTRYTEANMDAFLNRHMKRLNDEGEGPAREDLRRRFRQAMRGAQAIFGKDAFRKRYAANDRRKPINKALFEVWSVALGNLDPASLDALVTRRADVKSAVIAVLRDDRDFEGSISQGTGDVNRVQKRFSTVEGIVRRVLKEPT